MQLHAQALLPTVAQQSRDRETAAVLDVGGLLQRLQDQREVVPADPVRGRRWADHRRTLEAVAWKYRTNSPWRDLPDELDSFQTAHERLTRWAVEGTWEMILTAILSSADANDDIEWTVSVDSTVVQAHQHAAGALKRRPTPASPPITRSNAPPAG